MKLKSLAITIASLFSIFVVISPLLPTQSDVAAPTQSSEIMKWSAFGAAGLEPFNPYSKMTS